MAIYLRAFTVPSTMANVPTPWKEMQARTIKLNVGSRGEATQHDNLSHILVSACRIPEQQRDDRFFPITT